MSDHFDAEQDDSSGDRPWRDAGMPVHASTPASSAHRGLLVGLSASLAAVVLLAGAVGYLLGDRVGPYRSPLDFGASGLGPSNAYGGQGPYGGTGVFQFPGFGSGNPGASTSNTVPAAVLTSEKALVDVNTTIDDGEAAGAGTGIVLTSGGLVLTNNHVIDGAATVSVTDLGNDRTYDATVLGYDLRGDVAVLKLDGASGLAAASIASTSSVGQTVYAVGNAGGTGGSPTVTSGTITASGQTVTASDSFNQTSETLNGMFETNAPLISGDSGGALTAGDGRVVGMDTAAAPSGSGSNVGYAIPISTALTLAYDIIGGRSSADVHVGPTALLGVDIDGSSSSTNGAGVTSVAPGTPASSAGITTGSRITSVGGETVTTPAGLRLVMATLTPGRKAVVTWIDPKGRSRTATVVLATGAPQ